MAPPYYVKGLNVGLVVFSLLVLGGAAAYLSSGKTVNVKTGASNVIESTTGKLVKQGTPAFSPCKSVTTAYALIGATEITASNAQNQTPSPRPSPKSASPACTPLQVNSTLADPLVGLRVMATGTLQNGIFYATSLSAVTPATPSPRPTPRTNAAPSINPAGRPVPASFY